MKKTLLAIATVATLGSSAAFAQAPTNSDQVNITFQGEVVTEACKIEVANNGGTVDLGLVKENSQGKVVPIELKFTSCGSTLTTVQDIKFQSAQYGTADPTNVVLKTEDEKTKVAVYKDVTATTPLTQAEKLAVNETITGGNASITKLYARMEAASGAATGPKKTVGTFSVSYQ